MRLLQLQHFYLEGAAQSILLADGVCSSVFVVASYTELQKHCQALADSVDKVQAQDSSWLCDFELTGASSAECYERAYW